MELFIKSQSETQRVNWFSSLPDKYRDNIV